MAGSLVPRNDDSLARQGPSSLERRGQSGRVRKAFEEAGVHAAAERAQALKAELAASLYGEIVDHAEGVEHEYLHRSFEREDAIGHDQQREAFIRAASDHRADLHAGLRAVNRLAMERIAEEVERPVDVERKRWWQR